MIDLSAFALPDGEGTAPVTIAPAKPTAARRRSLFIKGPVDWAWITRAGSCGGRALHVGVVLWLERGMKGEEPVVLPYKRLREMNVDRHAARRGLAELEQRGLVTVVRKPGQSPRVTMIF